MKIDLNLPARIRLIDLLPARGNLVTLKVVQDLTMKLALSQIEIQLWKVLVDGNSVTWDPTLDLSKTLVSYDLGTEEVKIVCQAILRADGEERLTVSDLPLAQLFLEEKSHAHEA